MKKYEEEVKARWGNTDAYRESIERRKGQTAEDEQRAADGLRERFAAFGAVGNGSPDSAETQAAVKALQDFITAHFYTCTKEILSCLGEIYLADDRFRENIDRAGGEGTSAFVSDAIRIYCR